MDIYNAGVFRYEGIFLALPAVYHARGERWTSHTLRFTLIQLWHSRDLCTWERAANRQTFLPWSPLGSGAYDLTKNMPPSYPRKTRMIVNTGINPRRGHANGIS